MLSFLKNHPFAVEAFFESSLVFTFAFPKEQLQALIPPCLQLDLFDNNWAFIAIAMVQTRDLRPKGFPRKLGNNFFLAGYRVFVQYHNNAGKRLRGLYILQSATDKKKMEFLGNIFTQYNYSTVDIKQVSTGGNTIIQSVKAGFQVAVEPADENMALPAGSPFANWKEARRFAGPLPFTFTWQPATKKVLIIEGVRQHWVPQPLKVTDYHFSFLDNPPLSGGILANAFGVYNIPYYWKKGRTELWKQ